MLELFKNMMKEEWRLHSSLYGGLLFALFPIFIFIASFFISILYPIFERIFSRNIIVFLLNSLFLLIGMSVGGFGLFSREVLNRRFGQVSFIAYSVRTLPVSEKIVFLNFYIKDIIYYLIFWILPFIAGFTVSSLIISTTLFFSIPLLLLTSLISFMIGLSLIFLLSTIYAHSPKILVIILTSFFLLALFVRSFFEFDLKKLIPSYTLLLDFSIEKFLISIGLILFCTTFSILFLKIDYPMRKRHYANELRKLTRLFKFTKYSLFMAKDFLDLKRSEGGLGKIIFSLILPLLFSWFLVSFLSQFILQVNSLLIFSILVGIFSSTIYNWLTEYDPPNLYFFLPVEISVLIRSKIWSYLIIDTLSALILLTIAVYTNQFLFLPIALILFVSLSLYTLSVTIYLTGLYPNILLYNAKIFFEYVILILPASLILIFLSIISSILPLIAASLIPISMILIKMSCRKWEKWFRSI